MTVSGSAAEPGLPGVQPGDPNPPGSGWTRGLIALAPLAVLLWLLWVVRAALPPFAIALLISLLLDPWIRQAERQGWSRTRAVAVVFVAFLMLFAAVVITLVPLGVHQAGQLADALAYNIRTAPHALPNWFARVSRRLPLPPYLAASLHAQLVQFGNTIPAAVGAASATVLGSASRLLWLIIIPLATFYLLMDLPHFGAAALRWVPTRYQEKLLAMLGEMLGVFIAYVRGLLIVALTNGVVTTIALGVVFRLPYALVLGSVAGILYIVPYLGPVLIVLICGLVSYISGGSVSHTGILVGYLVLQNQILFDQIVTPRVLAGRVGLHPLASLFAMVCGGQLFGLFGVILAVPVAASLAVVIRYVGAGWRLAAPEVDSGAPQ